MDIIEIKKILVELQNRHKRKKSLYYIVEGYHACREVVKTDLKECLAIIYVNQHKRFLNINKLNFLVETSFFSKYSLTNSPQGIMILFKKKKLSLPSFIGDFQIVLDEIQDPGNMGTILRTCLAIGVKEVILTKRCVDIYNPKVIRSSLAANFFLNLTKIESLSKLVSKSKKKIWLSTPRNGLSCYSPDFNLKNSLLVFGNESNGIKNLSLGENLSIPMPGGFESLNVAQAATVILFEGVRKLGFFDR